MTPNSNQFTPDLRAFEHWREVYDEIIHWYALADSKSLGIITIAGILLSFVTLGFIISPERLDIFQSTGSIMFNWIFILIFCFLVSVIISVILAIYALWARIPFSRKQRKSEPLPKIFFLEIAYAYPLLPDNSKYKPGHTFYEKEVKPYISSPDKWLEAISAEIVILSRDVKKKYSWINISFLAVIAALIFMALIVGVGYFMMRPT